MSWSRKNFGSYFQYKPMWQCTDGCQNITDVAQHNYKYNFVDDSNDNIKNWNIRRVSFTYKPVGNEQKKYRIR